MVHPAMLPCDTGGHMSAERKSRFPVKLFALALIGAGAYVHGCRVITLEEIPSSHRPWDVYLTADYQKAHLQEANWLEGLR